MRRIEEKRERECVRRRKELGESVRRRKSRNSVRRKFRAQIRRAEGRVINEERFRRRRKARRSERANKKGKGEREDETAKVSVSLEARREEAR